MICMKRFFSLMMCLAVFVISLPLISPVKTDASSQYEDYINEVFKIVNQERAANGVEPLRLNSDLCKAAAVRSQEINTLFEHTRPDGTDCYTVLEEMNIQYLGMGENIAAGASTPESVMKNWMNSTGHRANILRSDFTDIGIGVVYIPGSYYGWYWTQIFTYSKFRRSITVEDFGSKTYGDTPFKISASNSGSGGNNYTYSSSNKNVAEVSDDGTVTIKGAGSAEITVTLPENYFYEEASVKKKLTVSKRSVTLTDVNYAEKTRVLANSIKGDDVDIDYDKLNIDAVTLNGDQVTADVSGIVLTGSAAKNYQLASAAAKITLSPDEISSITVDCDGSTKKYIRFVGSTFAVSAPTELGHYVTNWLIDGKSVSTDEKYTLTVTGDLSLTALTDETKLGDVDLDGMVTAVDASAILSEYAELSSGSSGTFTRIQKAAADVDNNYLTDSRDASMILSYYAYLSSNGVINDMIPWLKQQ